MKAFLTFLHITKSIYVSYDNIFMKIISERNYFILDQCDWFSRIIKTMCVDGFIEKLSQSSKLKGAEACKNCFVLVFVYGWLKNNFIRITK